MSVISLHIFNKRTLQMQSFRNTNILFIFIILAVLQIIPKCQHGVT